MESNGSYFLNQRTLKHVIQQKYLMQLKIFFILQTCVIFNEIANFPPFYVSVEISSDHNMQYA